MEGRWPGIYLGHGFPADTLKLLDDIPSQYSAPLCAPLGSCLPAALFHRNIGNSEFAFSSYRTIQDVPAACLT